MVDTTQPANSAAAQIMGRAAESRLGGILKKSPCPKRVMIGERRNFCYPDLERAI
jgi:hypothetical protein